MAAALTLKSIQFSYTGNALTVPLIRMTPSGVEKAPNPEWEPGSLAKDSLVALNIQALPAEIKVKVKLERSGASINKLTLRALADTASNVLASVPETDLSFSGTGRTLKATVAVKLAANLGVRKHQDRLRWEYRLPGQAAFTPLADTEHVIFTVLGEPSDPWKASPVKKRVWADVLEFACDWAAGETTPDKAADRICRRYFQLGEPSDDLLDYCGLSQYAGDLFDCADFIRTLRGEPNQARRVNCSDSAAVISTFAAALGAKLTQQRTSSADQTNSIRLIGETQAHAGGGISYHELAWGGAGRVDDPIWDGSLELNNDPLNPVVAAGMKFSDYAPRFTADALNPNTSTLKARPLGSFQGIACSLAKRAATPTSGVLPGVSVLVLGLSPANLIPRLMLARANRFHCGDPALSFFDAYYRLDWKRKGLLLRVQSALFTNDESAAAFLRSRMEECSALSGDAAIGEFSFRLADGSAAGFRIGNAAIIALNAGPADYSLLEALQPLARQLAAIPENLAPPAPGPRQMPGVLPGLRVMEVRKREQEGVWHRWVTYSGRLVYERGRVILLPYTRETPQVLHCRHRSPTDYEEVLLRL
jgi:hypothetical protein